MTDELHDAAKLAGETDYREKHDRQSRTYEVLDVLITAAVWQSGQVREGMADFLKASPILAADLARWLGEKPTTPADNGRADQ